MEDWVTIKNLKAKNPSMGFREIGSLFHISHNTVKKAFSGESPPQYQRPEKVNPDLEPFKEVIFEMSNVKKFKVQEYFRSFAQKDTKEEKLLFTFI